MIDKEQKAKEYRKQYYQRNKDKIKQQTKDYYEKNKNKVIKKARILSKKSR